MCYHHWYVAYCNQSAVHLQIHQCRIQFMTAMAKDILYIDIVITSDLVNELWNADIDAETNSTRHPFRVTLHTRPLSIYPFLSRPLSGTAPDILDPNSQWAPHRVIMSGLSLAAPPSATPQGGTSLHSQMAWDRVSLSDVQAEDLWHHPLGCQDATAHSVGPLDQRRLGER